MKKPVPGHVKYMCASTLCVMIGIGNQLFNGDTNATTAWYLAAGATCLKGLRELRSEGNLNLPGLKRGLFAIWRRVTPGTEKSLSSQKVSLAAPNKLS